MEKFAIGVLVGAVGGALLAANSYKMRTLVKKGQEEVKQRLDEMMDEKLKEMNVGCYCSSTEGGESGGKDSQANISSSASESGSEENGAERESEKDENKKKSADRSK